MLVVRSGSEHWDMIVIEVWQEAGGGRGEGGGEEGEEGEGEGEEGEGEGEDN